LKLYATITSERATKGQGGKYLNIEICGEDKLPLICIDVELAQDDGIQAKMFLMGDDRTAKTLIAYPPEDNTQACSEGEWMEESTDELCYCNLNGKHNISYHGIDDTKAKRQKGDKLNEAVDKMFTTEGRE